MNKVIVVVKYNEEKSEVISLTRAYNASEHLIFVFFNSVIIYKTSRKGVYVNEYLSIDIY